MRATNYLCIDDQRADVIDPLVKRLSTERLTITRATPREMSVQIQLIKDFLGANSQGAVGILLDLRIDMEADQDGMRVDYRGPALAQELRTRMAESDIDASPIVLWSVNSKFQRSFSPDGSAHDLFDAVYDKDERIASEPEAVSLELEALAEGYLRIRNQLPSEGPLPLIGIDPARSAVYGRFVAEYEIICGRKNIHEIARFLLDSLVRREGLLVNEQTLSARLGVDIQASGEAWSELKNLLDPMLYGGPFSSAWSRWWWFQVENWWASISAGRNDLRRLSAQQRVDRISERTGLKMVPPQPILDSYSTKFFTICAGTKRPLDPIDGLRVMSFGDRDWHDVRYVSEYAALERVSKSEWTLDPLDRARFDSLREMSGNGKES
jgi:hypothetical protein